VRFEQWKLSDFFVIFDVFFVLFFVSRSNRPPVDEKSAMRKNAADNFNQMFQQVNNIMQKRKQEGGGGGAEKRIKY
jgi:hypothetical protein